MRMLERDFGAHTRWLTEVGGYCFGTQGYLITRKAAAVFAERFGAVRRPVDDEMDRSWSHGVRNLAVFPFPIMERAQKSGIGLKRFERSEEHTSELQSLMRISYAVFCLKKKIKENREQDSH